MDELVALKTIIPPADKEFIVADSGSELQREQCRYVNSGGTVTYKLSFPNLKECQLEFMVGNAYAIFGSKDGVLWHEILTANKSGIDSEPFQKDITWIRMVEVTDYLNPTGTVYVKFTSTDDKSRNNNQPAYLQRITVYGIYQTNTIFARFSPTLAGNNNELEIKQITFRQW